MSGKGEREKWREFNTWGVIASILLRKSDPV